MPKLIRTLIASTILVGTCAAVAPAFADDAGIHDFMNSGSTSAQQAAPSTSQYRATYTYRNTTPNPPAVTAPQKDPQYFYHAQGSMGTN